MSSKSSIISFRVYPRVCGGACALYRSVATRRGLSPRVRGSPRHCASPCPSLRSIPACAGEPPSDSSLSPSRRVYPRVCGGAVVVTGRVSYQLGLSPRVRGSPDPVLNLRSLVGSIPACAGEPSGGPQVRRPAWVYPRVCGGAVDSRAVAGGSRGLSPRVRGSRSELGSCLSSAGSIPACAGEPLGQPWPERTGRVYPRVCGGADLRNASPVDR